jgi:hypothetical protein
VSVGIVDGGPTLTEGFETLQGNAGRKRRQHALLTESLIVVLDLTRAFPTVTGGLVVDDVHAPPPLPATRPLPRRPARPPHARRPAAGETALTRACRGRSGDAARAAVVVGAAATPRFVLRIIAGLAAGRTRARQ